MKTLTLRMAMALAACGLAQGCANLDQARVPTADQPAKPLQSVVMTGSKLPMKTTPYHVVQTRGQDMSDGAPPNPGAWNPVPQGRGALKQ
ncbi:MAG: hypothetical protein JNK75_01565 [Betaproteobacteria bacterium]|nr:hypothetical protein [Betaproteobacteria bacterium]